MIRIIFFLFFCFSCNIAIGQLEGNNWYFGRYAGLEFSTGTPQPVYDGQLSTFEGCASVSDKAGNLLFYTDGRFVYDRNHNLMPNGTGLMGDPSSVQSAVVCPKPGTWNTVLGQFDGYIICTVDNAAGPNGIRWSEVDMTANAGNGAVVAATKNTLLIGTTTVEAANFARHENGCDYWLLTKEVGNTTWRVFPVTSSGVGNIPVTSNQGPTTPTAWGTIKASPNSEIVALSNSVEGVHIFDFDKTTGQLLYKYGDDIGNHYSLEFSPNGEQIYYTCLSNPNIYQLDLNSANQVDFLASKVIIGSTTNTAHVYRLGALQLGPDGKIYLALRNTTFLGVINNPDLVGVASNYVDFAVDIGGTNTNGVATRVELGLPSFPTFFFVAEQSIVYNQFCNTLDGTLSLSSYENVQDQFWYVTPTGNAFSNTFNSTDSSYLTTLTAGEYDVKVVLDYGCFLDSATKTIEVAPIPLVPDLGNDTCFVSDFVLDLGAGYDLFEWQDGTTNQTNTVDQHGTYFCEVGSIGGNLVVNGDFEEGDTLFSSAYNYSSPAVNQGGYTVGTTTTAGWWANCADHTSGTGNMLIADGACGSNGVAGGADLWCQTIYVQPNTDYIFSAWLANGNINNSTAQLGFYADGAIIGGGVTSSALTCDWNQYSQVWNSGASTSVDICLKELSGVCGGADFIVDDIAFAPICYQTDTIEVFPSPQAIFVADPVCAGSPSNFVDQSTTATGSINSWSWDFEDNGSIDATTQNPSNTYISDGVYQANLSVVNSHGCSDDTTISVTVNPLPTATIAGTITVCQGDVAPTVTFTGANGTAPYTFIYNIGGGIAQTIVSVGNTVTLAAPTATVGTFDYNLVSVTDASTTVCSQAQVDLATVTVNPLPTATIAGTITVCQGDVTPTITFTGASGTAPYTFSYNIDGGATQTIISVGNTATIAAPTGTAGTFDYNLLSVADASATVCSQAQIDMATVTVNPLPTATIAGTITVCQGDVAPTVTFTGANGTAPYTFTYNIGGGLDQTIVSVGNTATLAAPTGTVGTFDYNLVSVADASATTCSQAQIDLATVTVNPLPTATIAGTITVCQGDVSPTITFTGANGTAPYTFTYNIDGGAAQTIISVGNTATLAAPTGTVGTFDYNLVSVADASATVCSQIQIALATVTVNPLPTATIAGTVTVCQGDVDPTITFTGANGTAPYTFSYNINGGITQTIVSVGNTATVAAPTATDGTFDYNLLSVADASATVCSQAQIDIVTVTVNPLPTATIAGAITVCQGDVAPTITFTGASGTAPYTFNYNIDGGATQTIVSVGNTATITAPTATVGTFDYNLLSVADASPTVCSRAQIDLVTITVSPLPTATIAGTITVCEGDIAPTITFTGANGTAPYTFSYNIDGGATQTIVSVGNTATITAPTGTVGTFDYNLVSVADASASVCSQVQAGVATITVNPLPTATVAGTISVCQGDTDPTITFTGANGTAPYVFTYNINNTANVTITSTGSTATVNVPTIAAGVYNFNLVSVSDASSTVCSQIISSTATVTVNDLPIVFAGNDTIICEGDQIVLSGQGASSYVWDQGVVNGVSFGPGATATYTVIGTDVNGCSNTDDILITIEPAAVVSFAGDVLSGCEPLEVTFTNTTAGSFDECVWTLGNGAVLNGCGSVTTLFNTEGTYDVTLTTTTAIGCVASATYTDYIYVEAIPDASFIPSSTLINNIDPQIYLENTSIGAVTYQWDFGNESPVSTEVSPNYTYPTDVSGYYVIELVAYSPLGCSDTAHVNVELVEEVIYYIPNTFTPDGDAFNQTFQPVFSSGYDPYDFTMLIFNRWGETIFESHNAEIGWDGTFGGKMVQDGTYSWKIEFKTTNSDERKVVVGHVNMMK